MPTSDIGRSELVDLLVLGARADRVEIEDGPSARCLAACSAAFIRCRRFATAALHLLDQDLQIEAEVETRSLMEAAVGLAWLLEGDLCERVERLRLKDLDSRIRIYADILEAEAETDDSDGEAESVPADVADDPEDPFEDPRLEFLNGMRAERDRLSAQGVARPPKVRAMAEELGWGIGYLDFAFKSEARTHFRLLGLEPFVHPRGEGGDWLVDTNAPGTQLEDPPYETAAMWLLLATKAVASRFEPASSWPAHLDVIEQRIIEGIERR